MLEFNLDQLQSQKLMMTPELKQSIQILQFSSIELGAYLQEQAIENPVIEIESYYDPFVKRNGAYRSVSTSDFDRVARIATHGETLESNIINQLFMTQYPDEVYKIVAFLAGNLNESGYLTIGLEETSEIFNLPLNAIEQSLRIMQSFDPPGVGARDLKECLQLQIKRDAHAPLIVNVLVSDYLNELARGKFEIIARELGISKEEVEAGMVYIRKLNPRPWVSLGFTESERLIVDAQVITHSAQWQQIIINKKIIPKISINENYKELQSNFVSEVQKYYQEKIKSAHWLIRCINQRNNTLQKVIQAIVEEQSAFFATKHACLKPMNLKVVSQKLGLHESTISRAVREKYIETPRGIFELKYFFTNAIQTLEGDQISSKIVKNRINEVIASEQQIKPFSDQEIANILQKEGIQISRRTVTKYREEDRILSSSFRKNK